MKYQVPFETLQVKDYFFNLFLLLRAFEAFEANTPRNQGLYILKRSVLTQYSPSR